MLNRFRQFSVSLTRLIFVYVILISITYASSIPAPQKLMEDTSKEMIEAFMSNAQAIKTNPDIAHQLIINNLVPKINFPLMSRWVLGKNWRKATKAQKQTFQTEFQELVIKFYSEALLEFLQDNELTPEMIIFMPYRGKIKGKYATVRSKVFPPSGAEPVKVNYDLYYGKSGQWQVYDVSIEGISLVTSYRSSFKQIIKKSGMDALLLELKNKNASLKTLQDKGKSTSQLTANGK